MPDLVEKIVALHEVLGDALIPHAFGGALALAWCTERARGTIDIDINVFLPTASYQLVVNVLPAGVKVRKKDLTVLARDGQVRVWWDTTPIDLFLNTTHFHEELGTRVRWETFGGTSIPFLSCLDLAVFKAFFNRTKDWADLEAMAEAGSLNVLRVSEIISGFLGADDERVGRLMTLSGISDQH